MRRGMEWTRMLSWDSLKIDLARVHLSEKCDRNRDFEGAGHWEALVCAMANLPPAGEMSRVQSQLCIVYFLKFLEKGHHRGLSVLVD